MIQEIINSPIFYIVLMLLIIAYFITCFEKPVSSTKKYKKLGIIDPSASKQVFIITDENGNLSPFDFSTQNLNSNLVINGGFKGSELRLDDKFIIGYNNPSNFFYVAPSNGSGGWNWDKQIYLDSNGKFSINGGNLQIGGISLTSSELQNLKTLISGNTLQNLTTLSNNINSYVKYGDNFEILMPDIAYDGSGNRLWINTGNQWEALLRWSGGAKSKFQLVKL